MSEYAQRILLPYINSRRDAYEKPKLPALLICDVFAAHRTVSFKDKLEDLEIHVVFVPAGCTSRLYLFIKNGHTLLYHYYKKKRYISGISTTRI